MGRAKSRRSPAIAPYNGSVGASRLDQFHRRATRLIRDWDAETSISNAERLDFLNWLLYEFGRRAAALEPAEGEKPVGGSGSGFKPVYL